MKDNVLHSIECTCNECLDKWKKVEHPSTDKKVMLFYGNEFYPYGGWDDFKGYFDSVEEAKNFTEKEEKDSSFMWAHIVQNDRIVVYGEPKKEKFILPEPLPWIWKNAK